MMTLIPDTDPPMPLQLRVGIWRDLAVPSVIGFVRRYRGRAAATMGLLMLGVSGWCVLALTSLTRGAGLAHRMNQTAKRAFGFFLILVALNMLRKVLVADLATDGFTI
jgi:hypothetical protein